MNNGKKLESFTDLNAWRYAHQLVLKIYQITRQFPKDQAYSLVDQMQRAAVSIVSNIAEGFSRESYKEKVQFYSVARGSTTELQSQLLIARDLHYLAPGVFKEIADLSVVVHKLITGLIKSSRSRKR